MRDVNNNKSFYRCMSRKRETRENMGLLLTGGERTQMVRRSQHGFVKGDVYSATQIDICDGMNVLVDEGRAVDVVCLNFSMVFNIAFHDTLIDKLVKYQVDIQTVRWIENWLNCQAERIVTRCMKPSWRPGTSGVPWD